MFKLENILLQLQVANGTTHYCKLKQGSKIVLFNSNTLIEFTKVPCTLTRNSELCLLNSRRKKLLNICLFVFYRPLCQMCVPTIATII